MADDNRYAPAFSIVAEGKDITAILQKYMSEITLTDFGGATQKSDELKISVTSPTLKLPSKGARLRLGMGFGGNLQDKGWFVVCGVSSSGPPRKVEIYATAAPMNASKQSGNVQSHKTRSWDSLTLGDIVKTVAADNGLIPRVAEKLAAIKIDHIDQTAESDANLMSRLARTYNAVSKPAGGYWLFLEQGTATTASGKQTGSITITPDQLSSWSYSDGSHGNTSGDKSNKIGVNYFDEADGKTKSVSIEHDGPAIYNPYTQFNKSTAEWGAKSRKSNAARNGKRMTLTGPCLPEHIPMTAECRVITSGFGEVEDRQWLVESLSFSLTTRGLSFSWSLALDISKKESGTKKGPAYFS
ncbi:late control protein D [Erwinia endophytica]|uniref:contractile injection system protein, VgrG/Pvc8 family n=1 Tax=Erwinia endophytica TaxID=1563158 RepID=UPI001265E6D8|nr:contractile injection system protein, VgrG/Pvc8 family [Erwinia endophytica]KAB8307267.1 late control protein D [Erwinia endophytica]